MLACAQTATGAPAAVAGRGGGRAQRSAGSARGGTRVQDHGDASAVVLFLASDGGRAASGESAAGSLEPLLASIPGMSVALLSATQGGAYEARQLLLDVSQGARVDSVDYARAAAPPLALATSDGEGRIVGWRAVLRRAGRVAGELEPGLLATAAGGAGYVGEPAGGQPDAPLAAQRSGKVAAVSLGSPTTLVGRLLALSGRMRLVVADLDARSGARQLRTIAAARRPGELIVVLERAPGTGGEELIWAGLAGDGSGGMLTSNSTREAGMLSAIDLAPTILAHLGVRIPRAMDGAPAFRAGPLGGARLRALKARLEALYDRRPFALASLLGACALLLAALSRRDRRRRRALRVGALALMWAPTAALLVAALEPAAPTEYALLAGGCLLLGALSDLLAPWPRAIALPAAAALAAITIDALAGTQLLMRSLLGPDPGAGMRFYGVGNELKSALAVLVLAGAASVCGGRREDADAAGGEGPAMRRARRLLPGAAAVLALVEGPALIGAGVGAVVLVSAGGLAGWLLLARERPAARRILVLAFVVPAVALAALAVLDLLLAGGVGQLSRTVLEAPSAGSLVEVAKRRWETSYAELSGGVMPLASASAVLLCAACLRWPARLLAPVGASRVWRAALGGGLCAGIVGTLVEDSGPVLLLVALFALACVLAYLWGRPPHAAMQARTAPARALR